MCAGQRKLALLASATTTVLYATVQYSTRTITTTTTTITTAFISATPQHGLVTCIFLGAL